MFFLTCTHKSNLFINSHEKACLHYQSFCDHSRNSEFCTGKVSVKDFVRNVLRELTLIVLNTESVPYQTFLTNPSKHKIYRYKIPIVVTETLQVYKQAG
jgi:hypothetical protein